MIPLLLYAQSADLITFAFTASALGISGESNPIASIIYTHAGILGIALYKVGIVAAWTTAALTWHKFTTLLVVIGIVMGTLGTLTNVASLAVSV